MTNSTTNTHFSTTYSESERNGEGMSGLLLIWTKWWAATFTVNPSCSRHAHCAETLRAKSMRNGDQFHPL